MEYKAEQFFDDNSRQFAKALQNEDFNEMNRIAPVVDFDHVGREDMTFIMWCIIHQKKSSLKRLLEMGANPNIKTANNESPVAVVCAAKDSDYLRVLLRYGGNANAILANKEPAILFTTMHGAWENVVLLLNHGADINSKDGNGETALIACIASSQYEKASKLVELGADLYQKDDLGYNSIDLIRSETPNSGTSAYNSLSELKKLLYRKGVKL